MSENEVHLKSEFGLGEIPAHWIDILEIFSEAASFGRPNHRGASERFVGESMGGLDGWQSVAYPDARYSKVVNYSRIRRRSHASRGRPSVFDSTQWNRFLCKLRQGLSVQSACAAVGLPYGRVANWRRRHPERKRAMDAAREAVVAEEQLRRTTAYCGREFGCLTVIEYAETDKNRQRQWLCKCTCGTIEVRLATRLVDTEKRGGVSQCAQCKRYARPRSDGSVGAQNDSEHPLG